MFLGCFPIERPFTKWYNCGNDRKIGIPIRSPIPCRIMIFIMIERISVVFVPCSLLKHVPQCVSRCLPVLGLSMTKGMIIAVVLLGIIVLLNRGGTIKEKLAYFIDHMNERKHVLRKHGPAIKAKLQKLIVVKPLTDEQIPQVKKQIKEISALIHRHVQTIHRQREAAVGIVRSSSLTAGRIQYEKEYARQVNMINSAVPKLITETDRIAAIDGEYKQQVHDWILAMRKSLEDYDPKYFEQIATAGNTLRLNTPLPLD